MLSLHASSCVKNNNTRQSPTTPFSMVRSFESPTPYPTNFDAQSPYIRPESANILASSYTCVTPVNGDPYIDNMASLDTMCVPPQIVDIHYARPDSVLSLPPNSEANFVTTDGYLPKDIVPLDTEQETYYDTEVNYHPQCNTYTNTVSDSQTKLNGLNDRCLV